jgi:hypothetical protein
MSDSMLAMELIPAIRKRLAALDAGRRSGVASGHRALWRAQSYAANLDNALEDLRRYALDSLAPGGQLEEEDHRPGYRCFRALLVEIQGIEALA